MSHTLEICFEGGLKVNNDLKKTVVYGSSNTYYYILLNMRGLVGVTTPTGTETGTGPVDCVLGGRCFVTTAGAACLAGVPCLDAASPVLGGTCAGTGDALDFFSGGVGTLVAASGAPGVGASTFRLRFSCGLRAPNRGRSAATLSEEQRGQAHGSGNIGMFRRSFQYFSPSFVPEAVDAQ
jgi:hypothetical protein